MGGSPLPGFSFLSKDRVKEHFTTDWTHPPSPDWGQELGLPQAGGAGLDFPGEALQALEVPSGAPNAAAAAADPHSPEWRRVQLLSGSAQPRPEKAVMGVVLGRHLCVWGRLFLYIL